jgi:hypothetical protein
MSDPSETEPSKTSERALRRLEDWIAVLSALATILLSLAIAALILERGS